VHGGASRGILHSLQDSDEEALEVTDEPALDQIDLAVAEVEPTADFDRRLGVQIERRCALKVRPVGCLGLERDGVAR
jgi:hypothetical protein